MFFVWILKISILPTSSGTPMSISRSNLPNLRKAGSMVFGLFVAPMTTHWPRPLTPSIKVNSWETTLFSTSPPVFSLLGAILSISSINIIEGLFFSASSKALRRLPSASPAILLMISGPLIKKKKAPVSFATALAIIVLPDPGGPYNNTPLGGLTPKVLKSEGWRRGSSIISLIWDNCLLQPPISSYPMSSGLSSSSLLTGSPSQCMIVSGATIANSPGSTSITLNSTGRNPPLTMNKSPFLTGRYASLK